MEFDLLQTMAGDLMLAGVLFVLFAYVARLSQHLRGIASWGCAHFVYSLGATLLDGAAPALTVAGYPGPAQMLLNGGAALACGGMVGLGWSIIQFTRQRPLERWELALMPLALALSLAAWALDGTIYGQSIALSIVEVFVLGLMAWHLRQLRRRPDRLPARMMLVGCALLIVLYGSVAPGWLAGGSGYDEIWVGADLSLWFMLNFCMLMLTSFRAAESLRQSAMYDPLTGALNRRGLQVELQMRLSRRPAPSWRAVIALDLDHFKAINDEHGHLMGDLVLRRFGDAVRECIRGDDLFSRLGGEEFAVVLVGPHARAAGLLADRIRERVAGLAFAPPAPPMRVTVSVGVCISSADDALADIMHRADEALYAAKRRGRNRVESLAPGV